MTLVTLKKLFLVECCFQPKIGLHLLLNKWFFFNLVEFKPKNKSYIFYL